MDESTKMEEHNKAPRGKSKSGRVWREPGCRSQSIVVPFGRKSSWKQKQVVRLETKAMKELERTMKETVQREKEARKKKLEEKRLRKQENEKKGEIVQKITNASKLKRLKKRQMRRIEKR